MLPLSYIMYTGAASSVFKLFLTYIIHCASAQFDPNLVFGHYKSSGDAHPRS